MRTLCVALLLVCACGCPVAPYNALVWNRENAAGHTGHIDTGPWYEWWYYKVVIPETGDAFYFVYGVVNPWDDAQIDPASRAYVGMGNAVTGEIVTQTYPVSEFSASYASTDVHIGEQHATDRAIAGSVTASDGTSISWDIAIAPKWSFNAMGWGMFVPEVTNIFWYPAQADARFSGRIEYKGRTYTFDQAPGYQDRNWGRTFPEWWAWIVANHFEGHPDTALAAGGGRPVILNTIHCIEGLAVGLRHQGRTYTFRPSEGDLERITVSFGTWKVEAWNRDGYRIDVEATAPCESFLDIVFPTPQGEMFHDFETLTGQVTVRLYQKTGMLQPMWRLIDTLVSDLAGIEYGHRDITLLDCHDAGEKVLYANF